MGITKNMIKLDPSQAVFVGLDVHKTTWSISVIHQSHLIFRATIPSDWEGLVKLLKRYKNHPIYSVYEAGFSGFHLHRRLCEAGIKNIITPPNKIPVLSGNRVKTDKIDSLKLATFLSQGLLSAIYIPCEKQSAMRQLLRTREQLKYQRTATINQLKGLLIQYNIQVKTPGLTQKSLRQLQHEKLPEEIQMVIQSYGTLWSTLSTQMRELRKRAELLASESIYQETYQRLQSAPGVGSLIAAAFALEIGDWNRFSNEKQISAFFGLTPAEYSSGEHTHRGRITGQGNPWLRGLLIQAAWRMIRIDFDMLKIYERLSQQTGSKKKAIVGIARKLICRLYAMEKSKQEYRRSAPRAAA